jgi:hypothetical protein
MTFTYTGALATDREKVRRLINDVDAGEPIFTDEELDGLMALRDGVFRGAALALRTIAANEAYVLKVMTRGDLKTDGTATAAGLRAVATEFDEMATQAENEADGGFDWAEQVVNDFTARERLEKQALRGQL